VITREEIRAYGWRTLAQALASLPGMQLTYDRQYEYIGTRGFGLPGDFNTRLLLAINGNRINDIVYDSGALGRHFPIDLDLIERIEFIPGPGGAVYGQNAMFGVVNVITRNGLQVDGWEFMSSWQEPQEAREARLSWGRRFADGTDVLLSLSSLHSHGEDLYLAFPHAGRGGRDIAGVARGMDGEDDEEFSARIGHGPWNLEVSYSSRLKDDPTAAYYADPLVPGMYERDDALLTQLQYQRDVGESWNLLARAFLGNERYAGWYELNGAGSYSTGVSEWAGGELRMLYTGLARHKLMFGAEFQDNGRIDQAVDQIEAVLPATLLPRITPSSDLLIQRDGYRAGVYAQDEWRLTDTLEVSLGLRLDRNDTNGTHSSPRAALIWQATDAVSLKALYGHAQRAPNSYERDYDDGDWIVGNPNLGRESIDTFEVVAENRMTRTVNLRASLYRWEMNDLIQLGIEPRMALPQYQSSGRVEAYGAEVSATAAWNSVGRMRASVSWQDVSYAHGGELPNSSEWLARLNYARPLTAALNLGFELQYDSERRTLDGLTVDGYWLANMNLVAGDVINGLDLSLTLLNLFDKRYEHPAADSNWQDTLEQDGRAVRLRLDYRF
jgi:outer membrane receptor protein involved in Fe transport